MSSESVNQKKSFGSQVISVAAFPAATAALGGVKSVIRNKGIKNAVNSLNREGFSALNSSLKNLKNDTFSRGLLLGDNYGEYLKLAKSATKLEKLVAKDKIPIKDRFCNVFRKIFAKDKVVTKDTIKENFKNAKADLDAAKTSLASGSQIATGAAQAAKTGFMKNVGGLISKGLKDPFVWLFTALETLPDIFKKVIPAFKNKGVKEGLKEAGKAALKTGENVISYVASSAIGRVIGSAIGTLICPGAGSMVGGNIGSMLAVSVGNIIKGKIFKKEDKTQEVQPIQDENSKKIYA